MGAPRVLRILRRRDFLALNRGRKSAAPGFVLQGLQRRDDPWPGAIRIGYTCSKKVGNAVARNRAKRRLRAAAAQVLAREGAAGWDYVLIGRRDATAAVPMDVMVADLRKALAKLHG